MKTLRQQPSKVQPLQSLLSNQKFRKILQFMISTKVFIIEEKARNPQMNIKVMEIFI